MKACDGVKTLGILMTYDVACRYDKKQQHRFHMWLPDDEDLVGRIDHAVPMMHLLAHKEDCQYCYSLNYMKHVSHTAGELIDTAWAKANNIGPSMYEMLPGHHYDVLNDFYNFWNWWKTFGMGIPLLQIHL